jgi:hypothetical protein
MEGKDDNHEFGKEKKEKITTTGFFVQENKLTKNKT